MEIRCSRCREVKPAEEFGWKRRDLDRRDSYCRPCRSEYGRDYYRANRDKRVAQDAARRIALRIERTRLLLAHFAAHPCADCGETDPVVLEFDHLRDKDFNIGSKFTHMGVAEGARRDREVRSRVRELPPSTHLRAQGHCAAGTAE